MLLSLAASRIMRVKRDVIWPRLQWLLTSTVKCQCFVYRPTTFDSPPPPSLRLLVARLHVIISPQSPQRRVNITAAIHRSVESRMFDLLRNEHLFSARKLIQQSFTRVCGDSNANSHKAGDREFFKSADPFFRQFHHAIFFSRQITWASAGRILRMKVIRTKGSNKDISNSTQCKRNYYWFLPSGFRYAACQGE